MNSFFTLHSFLEVGKTQDLPSKFWQTLVNALRRLKSRGPTLKKLINKGYAGRVYAKLNTEASREGFCRSEDMVYVSYYFLLLDVN
jgi:hypothetical protein